MFLPLFFKQVLTNAQPSRINKVSVKIIITTERLFSKQE